MGSKRICGVLGGLDFANVTRPDANNVCPTGLDPCSFETDANSTICYQEGSAATTCPITDISFMTSTASVPSSYGIVAFNDTTNIVFSRMASNNLPITTTRVEYQPCMDPFYQSNSPGKKFYGTELMQSGCSKEKNTGLTSDPRFT